MSDSPVLGKTGLFIARSFNGWFGVSSWFLPWLFINLSICFYKKTETRVRLTQAISTFGCLIFFCILANVRDCFSLTSNQSSIFESGLYEHGAGGSLGAVLYQECFY